jgi:hypothetical protein
MRLRLSNGYGAIVAGVTKSRRIFESPSYMARFAGNLSMAVCQQESCSCMVELPMQRLPKCRIESASGRRGLSDAKRKTSKYGPGRNDQGKKHGPHEAQVCGWMAYATFQPPLQGCSFVHFIWSSNTQSLLLETTVPQTLARRSTLTKVNRMNRLTVLRMMMRLQN